MSIKSGFRLLSAAFALAFLLASGCRKADVSPATDSSRPRQEKDPEQRLIEALDAAYAQASDLVVLGQTNEAVAVFEALLDNPDLKTWRDRLFAETIRFQLAVGLTDRVRERVLEACAGGNHAHAMSGVTLLIPHIQETEGAAAAYAIAETIAAIPGIEAPLLQWMAEWRFFTALNQADRDQAADALSAILTLCAPDTATSLLDRAFEQLLAEGRLDDLESLHRQVAAADGAREGRRATLLQTTKLRLAAGRGNWEETQTLFQAAAADLPDSALLTLTTQILPAARGASRTDVLDACAEEVIFKQGAKTAAASQAARYWAESAMMTNRAALPERLNALLATPIPTNQVDALFTRFFYDLLDDTAILRNLLPIASKLLSSADEHSAKSLKTMQLDGAFVLEEYDLAETYLKEGIPGRDPTWHKMVTCKVRAHRALKNNQPLEAVEQFRVFMSYIDDVTDDDTVDPTTGVQHTKDMLRGRNAKRIADILQAIPDAEGAAKARAEAAEYYQKAMNSVADAKTRALIVAEAGDLLNQ